MAHAVDGLEVDLLHLVPLAGPGEALSEAVGDPEELFSLLLPEGVLGEGGRHQEVGEGPAVASISGIPGWVLYAASHCQMCEQDDLVENIRPSGPRDL